MLNKFPLLAALAMITMTTGLAAKPVAYIYSLSHPEKISIIQGKTATKAARYLNLEDGATLKLADGSAITLFHTSGRKLSLDQKCAIRVTAQGIEPLDADTKAMIEAKGEMLVRPMGGSRDSSKNELPDHVQRELEAVEANIADPVGRALVKVEIFNKYGMKKRAKAEFENYEKLRKMR